MRKYISDYVLISKHWRTCYEGIQLSRAHCLWCHHFSFYSWKSDDPLQCHTHRLLFLINLVIFCRNMPYMVTLDCICFPWFPSNSCDVVLSTTECENESFCPQRFRRKAAKNVGVSGIKMLKISLTKVLISLASRKTPDYFVNRDKTISKNLLCILQMSP